MNVKRTVGMCLSVASLTLAVLWLFAAPMNAQAAGGGETEKGHWVYEGGKHRGCVSPGSDCYWSS